MEYVIVGLAAFWAGGFFYWWLSKEPIAEDKPEQKNEPQPFLWYHPVQRSTGEAIPKWKPMNTDPNIRSIYHDPYKPTVVIDNITYPGEIEDYFPACKCPDVNQCETWCAAKERFKRYHP